MKSSSRSRAGSSSHVGREKEMEKEGLSAAATTFAPRTEWARVAIVTPPHRSIRGRNDASNARRPSNLPKNNNGAPSAPLHLPRVISPPTAGHDKMTSPKRSQSAHSSAAVRPVERLKSTHRKPARTLTLGDLMADAADNRRHFHPSSNSQPLTPAKPSQQPDIRHLLSTTPLAPRTLFANPSNTILARSGSNTHAPADQHKIHDKQSRTPTQLLVGESGEGHQSIDAYHWSPGSDTFFRERQKPDARKKKLTSLKKRVLQERLKQWTDRNGYSSAAERASGDDCCSVCIVNYATAEELQQGEDFDEIRSDLRDLAEKIGPTRHTFLSREDGRAFVHFSERYHALAATACWNGMILGGNRIIVTLVEHAAIHEEDEWRDAMLRSSPLDIKQSAGREFISPELLADNDPSEGIVILENILTQDDFEDDDCLEETREDILALVRQFGSAEIKSIDLSGHRRGEVRVCYVGGRNMAVSAVEGLDGRIIGGNSITARLADGNIHTDASYTTTGEKERSLESTIILENVLADDDYEDEECLEETKNDLLTLARKFGEVEDIHIEVVEGETKGQVFIRFSGGRDVAMVGAKELDGTTIGGLEISARLAIPQECTTTDDHKVLNGVTLPSENTNSKQGDCRMKMSEAIVAAASSPPIIMYSGKKIISPKYAECKRVPKIANAGVPREYASSINNDDETVVRLLLFEMLGELMKRQIRSNKEDKNARSKRRLVMGLREVARGIRAHKIKMILMANNLDEYGVLDDRLREILDMAREDELPVIFDLNKRTLGRALGKTIKVAVVGIQNADGAHDSFKKLKALVMASNDYAQQQQQL